jgi:hypothetical protein
MNTTSFNKSSLKDECYMNLPTLSYYTDYYKNVSATDLIDVVAYIHDIASDSYIIKPVCIIKDMLENASNQQKIMINKNELDVWKIPCKIYDFNNDAHIEAIKLLSLNLKKFNMSPRLAIQAAKEARAGKTIAQEEHKIDESIPKKPHAIFLKAGKQLSIKKMKKMKRNTKTLKRK